MFIAAPAASQNYLEILFDLNYPAEVFTTQVAITLFSFLEGVGLITNILDRNIGIEFDTFACLVQFVSHVTPYKIPRHCAGG